MTATGCEPDDHPAQQARQFDKALFTLLKNLGPGLIQRLQHELTPGQVLLLYYVRQESHTVSALAKRMRVKPSAVTVMLDRLEQAGFIVRTREEADRRVVRVQVTPRGEDTVRKVLHARRQIVQACLSSIEPRKLDVFLNTLDQLADLSNEINLSSLPDDN
jgi:DNA-binding MarR family transcriptional regulator